MLRLAGEVRYYPPFVHNVLLARMLIENHTHMYYTYTVHMCEYTC